MVEVWRRGGLPATAGGFADVDSMTRPRHQLNGCAKAGLKHLWKPVSAAGLLQQLPEGKVARQLADGVSRLTPLAVAACRRAKAP